MINGNEMKAFYRIFIPRKKDDSEHSVSAQEVNETRLNDNFKTVLDEFRKLWNFIKNGFKTKTLEVEGNATIGGNASIGGNTYISGSASVGDRITLTDQSGSTTIEGHDYYIGAQSNGNLFVPYSVGVQGTDPDNRGVLALTGAGNGNDIRLDPTGISKISHDLKVYGNLRGHTLTVSDYANIGGDANIAGDANITGDANVSGNVTGDLFTANSVSVTEDVTVGLDLIVSEDVTVGGNATITGDASADDVTVGGVLTVTNRIADAVLSTAGWYRVMTFAGTSEWDVPGLTGALVRFNIERYGNTGSNGNHQIDLSWAYNHREFVNEFSNGEDVLVDKIRATTKGNEFYVDIHFAGTSAHRVTVDFDVKSFRRSLFTTNGLAAVADAPSGETIITTYTFGTSGAFFGDLYTNGTLLLPFLTKGTAIPSNADLNTYTTPGVYYATVAVAPTLTNANITTVPFKLIVMPMTGSALMQIHMADWDNCIIAMRRYNGSTWFGYRRITPVAV